jgi:hypothetical protein
MESINLLPELESIPAEALSEDVSSSFLLSRLADMEKDDYAVEYSVGVEKALLGLFDEQEIQGHLAEAYEKAFDHGELNLFQKYSESIGSGEESALSLVSSLKGRLAEMRCRDLLERHFPGYRFELSPDREQSLWNIRGVSDEGAQEILVQVKAESGLCSGIMTGSLEDSQDPIFNLGRDMFNQICDIRTDLAGPLYDTQVQDLVITQDVHEALESIAENMGIDLPDEIGDMIPYAGEITLGIKLVYDMIAVNRDFNDIHVDDRKKISILKALGLLSRYFVSSGCGVLTTAAGSVMLPGIGSILGSLAGIRLSKTLNDRLKPHVLEIALGVCELSTDDLFYFKNKAVIDELGSSLGTDSFIDNSVT